MKYPNAATDAFQGLPVEHCPFCGELISIEKSEIMQLDEISCNYCSRSIKAYLPKSEDQLFFTNECRNCGKMNNTRSQYCVFCGYSFSAKRKRFQIVGPRVVAYASLGFSLFGIIFLIIAFVMAVALTNIQTGMFYAGSVAMLIGLVLGIFSYINPKTRPIARLSLIISGFLDSAAIIFVIIVFIAMAS